MKEIFTDLYKKVAGFFQASEEKGKENAKDVACNRLKFVLMQDRTNLNPYLLERMRSEMIDVLSKYVEMDKEALELSFEQEGESMALMLSIPVIRAKEEEEIQALIAAEEEAKAAKAAAEAAEAAGNSEQETEESEGAEEVEDRTEELFEDEATETVDVESEADCEQRAKRLAEEQDVADPFSASNQAEAEVEEICGCGCESGEECSCGEDCGCETTEEAEEEVSEEPTSSKKSKRNKN